MRDRQVVKAPFLVELSENDYSKDSYIFTVDLLTSDSDIAPEYQNSASIAIFLGLTENSCIQDLQLVDRCEETSSICLGEEIWRTGCLLFGEHRTRNDIWVDIGIRVKVEWANQRNCGC